MMAIEAEKKIQAGWSVRRAESQDSAAVRQVARVTWEATYARTVTAANRARIIEISYSDAALRRAFDPNHNGWFWVAQNENNQIIGFAEAIIRPGLEDAELTRIYVLPSWQGQGVGVALVEALLADLRALRPDLRPPRLYLSVAADNQAAIGFYEKRGFRYSRNFISDLPGQKLAMREYFIEV